MGLMARLGRSMGAASARRAIVPVAQPARPVLVPQAKTKRVASKRAEAQREAQPQAQAQTSAKQQYDWIKKHERMVWKIAKKYAFGDEDKLKDLVQEGFMGLLHASKIWSPKGGANRNTYAMYWVRAYVMRAANKGRSLIPRDLSRVKGLVVSYELSLDTPFIDDEGEEGAPWVERLEGNAVTDEPVLDRDLAQRIRARIEELKPRLTPIQIDLIENRFLKEPKDTLDEVGARHTHGRMNDLSVRTTKKKWIGQPIPSALRRRAAGKTVTRERVRQIEQELIGFLKLYLERFR